MAITSMEATNVALASLSGWTMMVDNALDEEGRILRSEIGKLSWNVGRSKGRRNRKAEYREEEQMSMNRHVRDALTRRRDDKSVMYKQLLNNDDFVTQFYTVTRRTAILTQGIKYLNKAPMVHFNANRFVSLYFSFLATRLRHPGEIYMQNITIETQASSILRRLCIPSISYHRRVPQTIQAMAKTRIS